VIRKEIVLLVLAMSWSTVTVVEGDIITDNLAENPGGSWLADNLQWVATTFTSDNQSYQLDMITAVLDSRQNLDGTLFAAIFDLDTFDLPGSNLIDLSIGSVGTTASNVDLTPVSPFLIEANTTYFLVFGSFTGNDWVNTNATNSTNQLGPGSIGDGLWATNSITGAWEQEPGFSLFMSVQGTAIPEPGGCTLLSLGVCGLIALWRRKNYR